MFKCIIWFPLAIILGMLLIGVSIDKKDLTSDLCSENKCTEAIPCTVSYLDRNMECKYSYYCTEDGVLFNHISTCVENDSVLR